MSRYVGRVTGHGISIDEIKLRVAQMPSFSSSPGSGLTSCDQTPCGFRQTQVPASERCRVEQPAGAAIVSRRKYPLKDLQGGIEHDRLHFWIRREWSLRSRLCIHTHERPLGYISEALEGELEIAWAWRTTGGFPWCTDKPGGYRSC